MLIVSAESEVACPDIVDNAADADGELRPPDPGGLVVPLSLELGVDDLRAHLV